MFLTNLIPPHNLRLCGYGHHKKTRNDTIHGIISRSKSFTPYFNLNQQLLFLETIQDFFQILLLSYIHTNRISNGGKL